MIKKYKEFIKESTEIVRLNLKYINTRKQFGISKEEIEDYFLRLEEVFHCDIYVELSKTGFAEFKLDNITIIGDRNNEEDIENEILSIISRLKERCQIKFDITYETSFPKLQIEFKIIFSKNNPINEKRIEYRVDENFKYFRISNFLNIPKEEIEDYFLRLEEIFNCDIFSEDQIKGIPLDNKKKYIRIRFAYVNREEVRKEIEAIINRLKEKCSSNNLQNFEFSLHHKNGIEYRIDIIKYPKLNESDIPKKKLNESWVHFYTYKSSIMLSNYLDLSQEEIEDYFLRLEEIFNCDINFSEHPMQHNKFIEIDFHADYKNKEEIEKEIESIVNRLSDKCPHISFSQHIEGDQFIIVMSKKHKKKVNESTNLRDILSYEDVDDQFLRLKEICNCNFIFNYQRGNDKMYLQIGKRKIFGNKNIENIYGVAVPQIDERGKYLTDKKDIMTELENIKRRIEIMYPVKMYIGEFDPNIPKENIKEFGKLWAEVLHIVYGGRLKLNTDITRKDLIKISIISND